MSDPNPTSHAYRLRKAERHLADLRLIFQGLADEATTSTEVATEQRDKLAALSALCDEADRQTRVHGTPVYLSTWQVRGILDGEL